MPKVHRIHHTQLDSLSVALYGARTLFGTDGGPLEMASDFFLASFNKIEGENMSKLEFCHKSNLEFSMFTWCTF